MKSHRYHIADSASKSPAQRFWKHALILLTTALFAGAANSQVLTSGTFTTSSGAGGSGAQYSNCMIMSNGSSWSGGAVGVQGNAATMVGGGSPLAANVTFQFGIGSFVDTLNATYGIGNWTVSDIQLTVQYTLYANNTRFGSGPGTFDIYWVGNNNWVQGTNNPVYATSASALSSWSDGQALVASEAYNWSTPSYSGTLSDLHDGLWVTDKTGALQSTTSYALDSDPSLVNDITSASAADNSAVSLYLMATSNTMGMTIFTGGGSTLPTLTFDVQAVPEPSAAALLIAGFTGFVVLRFKRRTV